MKNLLEDLGMQDTTKKESSFDDLVGSYVIVRTYSAGVHAGKLVRREGKECTLVDTRRIYYWAGAATLSELASRGSSKPGECKFPKAIDRIDLTEAIEYIPCSQEGETSIRGVKEWTE